MRKTIIPLMILFCLQFSAGQPQANTGADKPLIPKINTFSFKLGDRNVLVRTYQYGTVRDMVYINLHDDEITAVNGARKILEKKGGFLIRIENYRTRNIKFKLEGKQYTIDPNRMFSRPGIARSLMISGNTSPKAIDEIEKFANRVLQLIPANPSWIIALHNNTNGKYSINSYRRGGDKQDDALGVNVNDDLDADDFFLTTDSLLFNRLSGEKYNAILQDNARAQRDGSLSVYCGERKINYINCETEHGRQPEYDEMIAVAAHKITGTSTEMIITARKEDASAQQPVAVPDKPVVKIPESASPVAKTDPKKVKGGGANKKTETRKNKPATNRPAVSTQTKPNPETIVYNYRIPIADKQFSLKPNAEIYFGDKIVGLVTAVSADSLTGTTGRLEMNKSFVLYSNMDFFLFVSASAPPRVELRIDPTRKGELVNPQTAIIRFTTKVVD